MGILSLLNQNIDARIGGTMVQEEFEGIIRYQIINAMENMDSGMMPAFTEYHIKGKDISIQMIGADDTKMARILIDGDQSILYMIDDEAKTAMKVMVRDDPDEKRIGNVPEEFKEAYEKALKEEDNVLDSEQIDLKETGKSMTIAGYECEKYIVAAETGEAFFESEVWLTEKIQVQVPDVLKDKNNPLLLFMNEKGFPLRFTGKTNSNGQSYDFEMVAIKVTPGSLNSDNFEIPADYHVSDMTSFLERK
jgi:hypothetical protein